jgi:hypothetical protein
MGAVIGRPREIEYDLDKIYAYAEVGCTYEEIARLIGVSPSNFVELRKKRPEIQEALDAGKANLHKSLRAKQVDVAIRDGNPQLLIFLGKAILDQRDKMDVNQNVTGDFKIVSRFGQKKAPDTDGGDRATGTSSEPGEDSE